MPGINIPPRERTIGLQSSPGERVWIRRPDLAELGPVIDAQLEQEKDRDAETREILSRHSAYLVAAKCVAVCVRSAPEASAEHDLDDEQAHALVVEEATAAGSLQDSELVRTCLGLCRVQRPKLTAEMVAHVLAARDSASGTSK